MRVLLVLFLVMFLFAGAAQAQTTNDLPKPGLLPGSPFYFLKNWVEEIGTFFTFGDIAKAERFISLSEMRLAEARALVKKGKPEFAEGVIGSYQAYLDRALTKAEEAKAKGLNTGAVFDKIHEVVLKQQPVLADVHDRGSEQVKSAIEQTIKQAIQEGMLKQEESLKIDAISTRLEGKDTILLQVQPGQIVPESEGLQYKGTPILPEIPTIEGTGENTPVQLEAQLETEKREIHAETPKVELKGLEVVKPKVENPITIQLETPSD